MPFSPLFIGAQVSTTNRRCRRARLALSVPSSSGHRFQLTQTSGRIAMPVVFQSPLHRGTGFNSLSQRANEQDREPFSPLFIGAQVSTSTCQLHAPLLVDPFSPLFIGAQVSTCLSVGDRLCSSAFSPLFIGAQVSTHRASPLSLRIHAFSPLFIGAQVSTTEVWRSACSALEAFSPLFIGAQVSTWKAVRAMLDTSRLSVPSSSGHRFQHGTSVAACGSTMTFSPLFIGAQVSTERSPLAIACDRFQSPLHRGTGFNAAARCD